ncbi:hypothetical protein LLQ46_10225, partial [Rouxiella badensis]|uniref:hypothetical protein n=1 Tax=Rouxiella badensis TaxID=1646377 RepID=UPI001D15ACF5
ALTGSTSINGLAVAEAYVVVQSVAFTGPLSAIATVGIYTSEADYTRGTAPLRVETRGLTYDGISAPWDYFEKQLISDGSYPDFTQVTTAEIVSPAAAERPSALITAVGSENTVALQVTEAS